jgi:hypothetical protein
MAQLVEQLTLNQRVPGSSPGGRTAKIILPLYNVLIVGSIIR